MGLRQVRPHAWCCVWIGKGCKGGKGAWKISGSCLRNKAFSAALRHLAASAADLRGRGSVKRQGKEGGVG